MRYIKLTKGYNAIIDDEDYERVNKYMWYFQAKKHNIGYAMHKNSKLNIQMHRLIMNAPDNKQVDHINKNGIDNRKCNLRLKLGIFYK